MVCLHFFKITAGGISRSQDNKFVKMPASVWRPYPPPRLRDTHKGPEGYAQSECVCKYPGGLDPMASGGREAEVVGGKLPRLGAGFDIRLPGG